MALLGYLWSNKIMSAVALYLVLSAMVLAGFGVDIGIPCLWRALFGFKCPGCGLTTASAALVQLNFAGAYNTNPLIFVVLPAGLILLLKDFKNYLASHTE